MRETEREVHLLSNGGKNDTLLFSRYRLTFSDAIWSDLRKLKIAKVRSDIGNIGRRSCTTKGHRKRLLLCCRLGGIVRYRHIACSNACHAGKRTLDTASKRGRCGRIGYGTRHLTIKFNGEAACWHNRRNADGTCPEIRQIFTEQRTAKSDQISAIRIKSNACGSSGNTGKRCIQSTLDSRSAGIKCQICGGNRCSTLRELKSKRTDRATLVHKNPLNFGYRRRTILHQTIINAATAIEKCFVSNIGVQQSADKTHQIALARAAVGSAIANADVGRAGAKHRCIRCLQVELVLCRIANHEGTCPGHCGGRRFNIWLDRNQCDILTCQSPAKAQRVVACAAPTADADHGAADLAETSRQRRLNSALISSSGNVATAVCFAVILQRERITNTLRMAANKNSLCFANTGNTIRYSLHHGINATQRTIVNNKCCKICGTQRSLEADGKTCCRTSRVGAVNRNRNVAIAPHIAH